MGPVGLSEWRHLQEPDHTRPGLGKLRSIRGVLSDEATFRLRWAWTLRALAPAPSESARAGGLRRGSGREGQDLFVSLGARPAPASASAESGPVPACSLQLGVVEVRRALRSGPSLPVERLCTRCLLAAARHAVPLKLTRAARQPLSSGACASKRSHLWRPHGVTAALRTCSVLVQWRSGGLYTP